MFSQPMRSRRFAPLFWRQFLSAFNGNFVRQMLAMLILFRWGRSIRGRTTFISILTGESTSPKMGGGVSVAAELGPVKFRPRSSEKSELKHGSCI
jgi:hypothetical protein